MRGSTIRRCLRGAALLAALSPSAALAQSTPDMAVQPPKLEGPQRGSVTGTLAQLSFGPGDLDRGSFALPSAMTAPSERGAPLVNVLPSYSAEGGISEWGMGWDTSLRITRHRVSGDVQFDAGDEFTSPWGRLRPGTDGKWYPSGLGSLVRLEQTPDGDWKATLPDATVLTFARRVTTAAGTYAWYVTRAETVLGAVTELTYSVNDSGRPFLDEVTYGSRGFTDAQRLRIVYETLARPFVSRRSGEAMVLDRRVSRVVAEVRHAATGQYAERWSYDLGYRQSPLGPAFFLEKVTRRHASGATEPDVVYEYDAGDAPLDAGTFTHLPALDTYLQSTGAAGVQPTKVAFTDIDEDGRIDIEHSFSFGLMRQTDAGWVSEPLPPAPPGAFAGCRPGPSVNNQPRRLVRVVPGAAEPHVVYTQYHASGQSTLAVCSRVGEVLYSALHDGDWRPDTSTRIADLDGDRKPDLIRFTPTSYRVLQNTSTPEAIAFTPHDAVPLTPSFMAKGHWVHDIDGDGLVDLVARGQNELVVWYGHGNRVFGDPPAVPGGPRQGRSLQLRLENQSLVTNLPAHHLAFLDANKDGLTDVTLTANGQSRLFLNQGDGFVRRAVAALQGASTSMSTPVIEDLSGGGNEEIIRTLGNKAYALSLNRPETGLLRAVRDGKGSRVELSYARAPAAPGVGARAPVLSALTVRTAGQAPVSFTYDYESPVIHSEGRFLVGYGLTRKISPFLTEEVAFHHDDDISGLVLETTSFDPVRAPGIAHFSRTSYTEQILAGVRFLRPSQAASGLRGALGEEIATTTEYDEYERDVCPVRQRTTNAHGELVREASLTDPGALAPPWAEALHCLSDREHLTATHADPTLDVVWEQSVARNALGQVTDVFQHDGASSLLLQHVEYDAEGRLASVARPGNGTTTLTYDPATGLLAGVTSPDGVVTTVAGRDPVSDLLVELAIDRGPGGELTSSFRFDGLERLQKRWQSFGGSSEGAPLEELLYAFPSLSESGPAGDRPGTIVARQLVDPATGSHSTEASLVGADGSALGSAALTPEGWLVSGISIADKTDLRSRGYRRSPMAGASAPADWTYGDLLAGAVELSAAATSGLGYAAGAQSVVQHGVTRSLSHEATLVDGTLVVHETENGDLTTTVARDAEGRTLWVLDPAGKKVSMRHDAMGRLVGVMLADGTTQTVRYDAMGRVAEAIRPGIGAVAYAYDPVTGLLASKVYRDRNGLVERTVAIERDALGRVTAEEHEAPATGAVRRFTFGHDGDRGAGLPPLAGHRGYRTRVEGDAFVRIEERNPDGTLRRATTEVGDWLRFDRESTYHADGSIRTMSETVTRIDTGEVIDEVVQEYVHDATGRLARVDLGGSPLATLVYDGEGQLARVDLPGGESIHYSHDPDTRMLNGYSQGQGQSASGASWSLNARGLVEHEHFQVAGTTVERIYEYDDRGFLESATDGLQSSYYTYGDSGLPAVVADVQGARDVDRGSSSGLTAGGQTYAYDDLGRVIQKGDTTFDYGPDGHLERAVRGADETRYAYDERGYRILKTKNGQPFAAFVGGVYATGNRVVRPVRIAGRLVGALDNGQFQLVDADPRGTRVFGTSDTIATPYGARAQRPALGEALDYVERGYDADLGTIRMGVRDYDPRLSQFWTPDPLFLESLDKCAESPVECNLYGYAKNDPIRFVDPTGTQSKEGLFDTYLRNKFGISMPLVELPQTVLGTVAQAMDNKIARRTIAGAIPFVDIVAPLLEHAVDQQDAVNKEFALRAYEMTIPYVASSLGAGVRSARERYGTGVRVGLRPEAAAGAAHYAREIFTNLEQLERDLDRWYGYSDFVRQNVSPPDRSFPLGEASRHMHSILSNPDSWGVIDSNAAGADPFDELRSFVRIDPEHMSQRSKDAILRHHTQIMQQQMLPRTGPSPSH